MGCCQIVHDFSLDFNEINLTTEPEISKPIRSTRDTQYEISEFNDISLESEIEEEATQLKQIRYEALTESTRNHYKTYEKCTSSLKLTNIFNIEEAIIRHSLKATDISNLQFFRKPDLRKLTTPPAYLREQQIGVPFRQCASKPCSFVNTPILIKSQEENLRDNMHEVEEDETQLIVHTIA